MSFWEDFKKFAVRGNAVDLAVGVVVGGAFGKIVTSLVNDIVLPPIGLLLGKVDFSNLFLVLGPGSYATLAEAKKAGVPVLGYGSFLSSLLDFTIQGGGGCGQAVWVDHHRGDCLGAGGEGFCGGEARY